MVKKDIIGKIQLILGIILLLAGIIGVILTYNWFNKEFENLASEMGNQMNIFRESVNYSSYSEDSKITQRIGIINFYANEGSLKTMIAINLGFLFVLSIIISLLFITQGLVNMKQINREKW